ncbi:Bidirectional sugar transporter SWEET [Forsythia ovata]|uniref:Bidirectional sugar transporter SWEET n=1 Tax=Forsythia ovata TaxID=205694 RepID=A0ABD1PV99_9LAMI
MEDATITENQVVKGSVVPPVVPESGTKQQPDVPDLGTEVHPDVPEAGTEVQPDVPESGTEVQPDMPESGTEMQFDVPESGTDRQPTQHKQPHSVKNSGSAQGRSHLSEGEDGFIRVDRKKKFSAAQKGKQRAGGQQAIYGTKGHSAHNILVTAINGTGAVIESIYVLIFLIFAPKKEKAKILGLVISILAVFSTIAVVSVFGLHDSKKRKLLCGFAASIFSIIMYASPLSVMRMVIQSKSVEYMPFCLSLFVFLCGTCWFIYGLIGNDPFLAVPNGFGCGLGAMQLILYVIYRGNKGETKKTCRNESLELGISKNNQQKKTNVLN